MNIKSKLIEQLSILEQMQSELLIVNEFGKVHDLSKTIIQLIIVIEDVQSVEESG